MLQGARGTCAQMKKAWQEHSSLKLSDSAGVVGPSVVQSF